MSKVNLRDLSFHFHGDECYAMGPGDTEVRVCQLIQKWQREGGMFGRKEAALELKRAIDGRAK